MNRSERLKYETAVKELERKRERERERERERGGGGGGERDMHVERQTHWQGDGEREIMHKR